MRSSMVAAIGHTSVHDTVKARRRAANPQLLESVVALTVAGAAADGRENLMDSRLADMGPRVVRPMPNGRNHKG